MVRNLSEKRKESKVKENEMIGPVKDIEIPTDTPEKSPENAGVANNDTAIEKASAEVSESVSNPDSTDAEVLDIAPNTDIPESINHVEITMVNGRIEIIEPSDTSDVIASENQNNTIEVTFGSAPQNANTGDIPAMTLTELVSVRRKRRSSKMPKAMRSVNRSRKKSISSFILCVLLAAVVGVGALWLIGYTSVSNSPSRQMLSQPCTVLPRSEQYTDTPDVSDSDASYPPSHYSGGFTGVVGLGFERVLSVSRPVAVSSEVEAGSKHISVDRFLRKDADAKFVTDMKSLDTSVPGCYQIELDIDGQIYHSFLFVIDTVAPVASVSDVIAYTGAPIDAINFFSNIVDETALTAHYETEPDFSAPYETNVTVILEDAGKNSIRHNAKLTVIDDVVPPVITGAVDRTVFIGETISYKDGVVVTDNKDGENITLNVDISKVNPTVAGQYPVTFSATDSTGLSTSVTVTFTVRTRAEQQLIDELNSLITPIYNSIIKDSMTQREKAYAIYKWTRSRIGYSGYSDKSDWRKAAIRGLKTRSGDCFTYFAISKAMLDHAGIDNIDVEKIKKPGRSRHYWSLINLGEGWYHFDSTQWVYKDADLFMLTDAQLDAFSRRHSNSHDFDHSLYPATPKS